MWVHLQPPGLCYAGGGERVKIVSLWICLTRFQFSSHLRYCWVGWCGMGWDKMDMKQKNIVSYLQEVILCWLRKNYLVQSFTLLESQETSFVVNLTYCPFPKVIVPPAQSKWSWTEEICRCRLRSRPKPFIKTRGYGIFLAVLALCNLPSGANF